VSCSVPTSNPLRPLDIDRPHGFSLLEVLVATTMLTVAVAGLAQLFALSTRINISARSTTFAAVLAQQKMEQLRSLTWGYDSAGVPVSDLSTNITAATESPTGGRGLSPSPADSLRANTDGYCDFVDGSGRSLGGGTNPPAGTVYIRRWSVALLPANPANTLVLQVLVTRHRNRGEADAAGVVRRLPDEARIAAVKTRKAG
jgi:prepilin-type N-terminal cleavage/methylation domain-containing protein